MNKLTKIIVFFSGLLAVVSCDSVEESYSVGDRPKDNEILSLNQSQLAFRPDGGSFEIEVTSIARWEITVANNNAGQFTVSPTSGKGNGTVTVTCKPNSTQNSYTVELSVVPLNFNMDPVKVSLRQNNATFSIERIPSSESVPEEGGSVTMTAYSSLNWELAVIPHDADGNVGDLTWLSVTPGISGDGNDGNTPIEYRFTWTPNYTEKERIIRLQLKPSADMDLSNLPQPFTLTQVAGTLPQNVGCVVEDLSVVDADVKLEYSSKSPVKDCGLNVYKVEGGNSTLLNTVRPEVEEYSLTGSYRLSLKDLTENSTFRIQPFVMNQVGSKAGEYREISTGTKPENMVYEGVKILNSEADPISISVEETSAMISFIVSSDVEPLENDRIDSVTLTVNGQTMSKAPLSSEAGIYKYAFNVNQLIPNHEYGFDISVRGKELPSSLGRVDKNTVTYSGKFRTKGQTPGDNDNNKPIVGE